MTTVRVLVVDDHDIVRTGLESVLRIAGYDVCTTASIDDAVRALDQRSFDLVVTDWQMPGGDGLELCRWLRADPRYAALRIVVFSAAASPDLATRANAAGADLCIPKHTSVEDFLAALAQLTRT